MLLGEEMRVCRKSDFNCIQMKQNTLCYEVHICTLSYMYTYLQREFYEFFRELYVQILQAYIARIPFMLESISFALSNFFCTLLVPALLAAAFCFCLTFKICCSVRRSLTILR